MQIIRKEKHGSSEVLHEGDAIECVGWLSENTPVRIARLKPHMMEQMEASGHPEWPPNGWTDEHQWLVGYLVNDRLEENGGFESAEDALRRGLSRIADGTIYAL